MTRVLASLSIAFAAAAAGAAQSERTFNVGVMRADGVLIPFAQFDRGTWRPFWTGVEGGRSFEIPVTLDDVEARWWREDPPSLDWTVWPSEGSTSSVRVQRPQAVYTPCGREVGLITDYKPTGMLPPPHQAPYPKAGLATTSASIAIEPIPEVPRGSIEWQRVEQALAKREFSNAENRALADMAWSHPVRSGEREARPIELQSVWHVKDSRFFYFEAMRRYPDRNPPKGKPPCELVTYVAGYFWEDPSEDLLPAGVTALITYCHMERAMFLWPFGVIRDGAKQYWLFQSAGWTGEVYGVSEPEPSRGFVRRHLFHVAGRCR